MHQLIVNKFACFIYHIQNQSKGLRQDMDISQGWICDTCGTLIDSPSDGRMEWLEYKSGGILKGRGLRLVHHLSASPLKASSTLGCYSYTETYASGLCDAELSEFLGDDGLMLLLSKLANDQLPQDEVIEMIKRLHVSGYEKARLHFDAAASADVFEPSADKGYYSRQDIEAVLEFIKSRD